MRGKGTAEAFTLLQAVEYDVDPEAPVIGAHLPDRSFSPRQDLIREQGSFAIPMIREMPPPETLS